MEGFLRVRKNGAWSGTRYFVVDASRGALCSGKSRATAWGSSARKIPLANLVSAEVLPGTAELVLRSKRKSYEFLAQDADEAVRWRRAVEEHIQVAAPVSRMRGWIAPRMTTSAPPPPPPPPPPRAMPPPPLPAKPAAAGSKSAVGGWVQGVLGTLAAFAGRQAVAAARAVGIDTKAVKSAGVGAALAACLVVVLLSGKSGPPAAPPAPSGPPAAAMAELERLRRLHAPPSLGARLASAVVSAVVLVIVVGLAVVLRWQLLQAGLWLMKTTASMTKNGLVGLVSREPKPAGEKRRSSKRRSGKREPGWTPSEAMKAAQAMVTDSLSGKEKTLHKPEARRRVEAVHLERTESFRERQRAAADKLGSALGQRRAASSALGEVAIPSSPKAIPPPPAAVALPPPRSERLLSESSVKSSSSKRTSRRGGGFMSMFGGSGKKKARDKRSSSKRTSEGRRSARRGRSPDPARSLPPPPLPPRPAANGAAGLAAPEYAKYAKMLSSGLPEGAVRNAMARDGVAEPPGVFGDDDLYAHAGDIKEQIKQAKQTGSSNKRSSKRSSKRRQPGAPEPDLLAELRAKQSAWGLPTGEVDG